MSHILNSNVSFINFGENHIVMQTASFTGVIETIFYIVLFYYIFKYALKLLLPMMLKKAVEKAGENFRQQSQNQYQNHDRPTNTQPKNSVKPRETKKVGEYVDFEELE
jgi:hypothetical protein